MLVDNGSKNFKGKHILDFVINPEEAEIVKLILSFIHEFKLWTKPDS